MPSKLDAIKIDNDLATDGAQAVGNKAVADALPDLAAVVANIFKPKHEHATQTIISMGFLRLEIMAFWILATRAV